MVATTEFTVGALGAEPTTADQLFVALDQHRIGGEADSVVEVSGIHEAPLGGVWVQIAVVGDPTQSVVLHLDARTTVHHAIAALEAWGKTPIAHRRSSIAVTPASRFV